MKNYAAVLLICSLGLLLAACNAHTMPTSCVGLHDIRLRPEAAKKLNRQELIAVARYRAYYKQNCKK